jgi:hypothetical protein
MLYINSLTQTCMKLHYSIPDHHVFVISLKSFVLEILNECTGYSVHSMYVFRSGAGYTGALCVQTVVLGIPGHCVFRQWCWVYLSTVCSDSGAGYTVGQKSI